MARYKSRPKYLLLQRICINGLLLDKFTPGVVIDQEHPADWESGCVLEDELIYLVEFENLDPAVGVRRVWLANEFILILDAELQNTPRATRLSPEGANPRIRKMCFERERSAALRVVQR